MSPERSCVPIVQIHHGFSQPLFEILTDVKAGPFWMHEVGRTSGAEHASRTRGPGSIEADHCDVGKVDACFCGSDCKTVCNLPQADFWSFSCVRGILEQLLDKELFSCV